jgi:hypothetical protein
VEFVFLEILFEIKYFTIKGIVESSQDKGEANVLIELDILEIDQVEVFKVGFE